MSSKPELGYGDRHMRPVSRYLVLIGVSKTYVKNQGCMSLSISQLGMAAMLHDIVEHACP